MTDIFDMAKKAFIDTKGDNELMAKAGFIFITWCAVQVEPKQYMIKKHYYYHVKTDRFLFVATAEMYGDKEVLPLYFEEEYIIPKSAYHKAIYRHELLKDLWKNEYSVLCNIFLSVPYNKRRELFINERVFNGTPSELWLMEKGFIDYDIDILDKYN